MVELGGTRRVPALDTLSRVRSSEAGYCDAAMVIAAHHVRSCDPDCEGHQELRPPHLIASPRAKWLGYTPTFNE